MYHFARFSCSELVNVFAFAVVGVDLASLQVCRPDCAENTAENLRGRGAADRRAAERLARRARVMGGPHRSLRSVRKRRASGTYPVTAVRNGTTGQRERRERRFMYVEFVMYKNNFNIQRLNENEIRMSSNFKFQRRQLPC